MGFVGVDEFAIDRCADVIILLCPDVGVAIGAFGYVIGHIAGLVNGADVGDARECDEEVKYTSVFAENGREKGPVACGTAIC